MKQVDPGRCGMGLSIREMPPSERPMERLLELGPEALSTAELIAVIIRCGRPGGKRSRCCFAGSLRMRYGEKTSDSRRMRAIEHTRNRTRSSGSDSCSHRTWQKGCSVGRGAKAFYIQRERCSGLAHAVNALSRKEEFRTIFLDTRNRVIESATISIGTLNSSIVHPREVFRAAIRAGSAGVILAHNHPSGDPAPRALRILQLQRGWCALAL